MKDRLSITITPGLREKVETFAGRNRGHKLATNFDEIASDFFVLYGLTVREIQTIFDEKEILYLYEALKGYTEPPEGPYVLTVKARVHEAEVFDHLSNRININTDDLRRRINQLAEFQAYILFKMSAEYWMKKRKSK